MDHIQIITSVFRLSDEEKKMIAKKYDPPQTNIIRPSLETDNYVVKNADTADTRFSVLADQTNDDSFSEPFHDLRQTQIVKSSQIPLIIQTNEEIPVQKVNTYYLVRVKTNEKIRLHSGKTIIGRSETKTDYQIIGNSTIGRVHASIELRDETCYITDLNSKNKTKINKVVLEPEKEYTLKNGDTIQFSNEVYVFKILKE